MVSAVSVPGFARGTTGSIGAAAAVTNTSDWLFPNAVADSFRYDEPSNVLRRDGAVARTSECCGALTVHDFTQLNLPAGTHVDKVEIRFHLAGVRTTATFQQYLPTFENCVDHAHPGYYKDFTPSSEIVLDDYYIEYTDQDCTFRPDLLASGDYYVGMVRYLGATANYAVDDISVRFTYTPPPNTVTISPTSGLIGGRYTASYACAVTPTYRVTQADGRQADGAALGVPMTGDGLNYAQSLRFDTAGSYVLHVDCAGVETRSPVVSVRDPLAYVALGDSYSSGEGVSPYFEPGNRCDRSTQAYPTLVEVPGSGTTYFSLRAAPYQNWGFLACAGATTRDVRNAQLGKAADQNNTNYLALNSRTSLVTITIGGNDVDFDKVLKFCAVNQSDCANAPYGGQPTLAAWVTRKLDTLASDLTLVYAKIREKAPNARLLVLGYPQLFPASPQEQDCPTLREYELRQGPLSLTIGFSRAEQNFLRAAETWLNETIATAVAAPGAGAGEFVSVDGTFAGHEVCGEQGQWINGLTLDASKWPPVASGSFHPTEVGQAQYAAVINRYLAPPS